MNTTLAGRKIKMSTFSKTLTREQYQQLARNMGVQELMSLAETFNECSTVNTIEALIRNVLNNEVERRIYNWEMTTA
jgi:predicted metal-dependent TIM-barrel fold hydrolase